MTEITEYAYIGIAPCGCVQAATIDRPEHKKEVRKDVMGMMKWVTIERTLVPQARIRLCWEQQPKDVCPHPQGCPTRPPGVTPAHRYRQDSEKQLPLVLSESQ